MLDDDNDDLKKTMVSNVLEIDSLVRPPGEGGGVPKLSTIFLLQACQFFLMV